MGKPRAMRVVALAALAAACIVVVAHASTEQVEGLEGGAVLGEAQTPGGSVVALTKGIKELQSDITNIREKKAESGAAAQAVGAAKDTAVKSHIDAATDEEDLDARQKQKEKQLVQATIEQHDAAKTDAVEANGASPAKVAGVDADDSSSVDGDVDTTGDTSDGDVDGDAGGYGGDEGDAGNAAIFDEFQSSFNQVHGSLTTQAKNVVEAMVQGENAVVKKIEASKQVVTTNIEKAKKAFQKESAARKKAQARAKEFEEKEKKAKSTEKKAKTQETETKKKMQEA